MRHLSVHAAVSSVLLLALPSCEEQTFDSDQGKERAFTGIYPVTGITRMADGADVFVEVLVGVDTLDEEEARVEAERVFAEFLPDAEVIAGEEDGWRYTQLGRKLSVPATYHYNPAR